MVTYFQLSESTRGVFSESVEPLMNFLPNIKREVGVGKVFFKN